MTQKSSHPFLNVMLLAFMFGLVGWKRLQAQPIPIRIRVREH